jgi:Protein of unknown function (DUF3500)
VQTAAADRFLSALSAEERDKVNHDIDAIEWYSCDKIVRLTCRRKWSNPEILFNDCGFRVEFLEQNKIDLAMDIVKASLSPLGYQKVRDAMRTNHFLGELVNARPILNEFSYK